MCWRCSGWKCLLFILPLKPLTPFQSDWECVLASVGIICRYCCSATGKQTQSEKLQEHSENNEQKRWGIEQWTPNHGTIPPGYLKNFNVLVFSGYLQPQWPLPPDYQTLFEQLFCQTLFMPKFLFLLTDVSLSLTPSETRWKVAAVSEVPPRSVLINHPQSFCSPLSPSTFPASLASSLSILI